MRKLYLTFLLLLPLALASFSAPSGGDSDYEQSEDATHTPAMILVEDGDVDDVIKELKEKGVTVLYHRKNILLTYIPLEYFESPQSRASKIRNTKGVKKVEISRPRANRPQMNFARGFNNANLINEGAGMPQPYDGKGVVVGLCDVGIDTRHPNFLNLAGTECRIRRAVHYQEQQGLRTVYDDPQEIYDWQTDEPENYHGTHTTGIAAGACPVNTSSGENYASLAPEADIVFTGSQLSDVGLLAGVEDIIQYAKEVEKPAVINLSMGNDVGPHDGSSLFTQYLDLCADDAIICISAGNNGSPGDSPKSMSYEFTEDNTEIRVLPNDWGGMEYWGDVEVWSEDDTPFSIMIYWNHNYNYNLRIDAYDPIISEDGTPVEWSISLDPDAPDFDQTLADHFNVGYVKAEVGISPLNGRYCAKLEFELETDQYRPGTNWALYWAGLQVKGQPGSKVYIHCGGNIFLRPEHTGKFPVPNNDMNISDLATGFKTISVGMMNNTLYGKESDPPGSGWAKGDVNINSSYGTLHDGRKLPMTVAPGAFVISSISSVFLENNPDFMKYIDDESEYDGKTYYWLGDQGTSMSSPYVAGAIATWLQAYPLLTSEEAIKIVQSTNQTTGYPNPDDPRHGQGWFNPYAGMLKVLDLAALKVGTMELPDFTLKVVGKDILIGNPSGRSLSLSVFDVSGMKSGGGEFNETLGSYSLAHLPAGIYLVSVKDKTGKMERVKVKI